MRTSATLGGGSEDGGEGRVTRRPPRRSRRPRRPRRDLRRAARSGDEARERARGALATARRPRRARPRLAPDELNALLLGGRPAWRTPAKCFSSTQIYHRVEAETLRRRRPGARQIPDGIRGLEVR